MGDRWGWKSSAQVDVSPGGVVAEVAGERACGVERCGWRMIRLLIRPVAMWVKYHPHVVQADVWLWAVRWIDREYDRDALAAFYARREE